MDIELVTSMLTDFLAENDLELYSVKKIREYGSDILQVLIDKSGGIGLDELAMCNEYLSTRLDEVDSNWPEYMLEVSSPGAEKELRSIEEIRDSIDSYVNLKTREKEEFEGKLLNVSDDETLEIVINIKGRMKKILVKYENIKKIRLAVHL